MLKISPDGLNGCGAYTLSAGLAGNGYGLGSNGPKPSGAAPPPPPDLAGYNKPGVDGKSGFSGCPTPDEFDGL